MRSVALDLSVRDTSTCAAEYFLVTLDETLALCGNGGFDGPDPIGPE